MSNYFFSFLFSDFTNFNIVIFYVLFSVARSAIYHLSNNPDSKFKGWYFGKIDSLGKMFQFGRTATYDSVKKLLEKELIEKDLETGFLRTTNIWWNEFVNFEIGKISEK